MSLLADAFQPHLASGLLELSGRLSAISLPETTIQRGVGYDLIWDAAGSTVALDFRDPRILTAAIASDLSRLACASFQTVNDVAADIEKKEGVPWGLIRLYYAAFYAAHAIMRLLGESGSYFSSIHIRRIQQVALALGKEAPFSITAGYYHCVLSADSTMVTCRQASGLSGGGHEAFWNIFGARLERAARQVLGGALVAQDAQAVFVKIDDLRSLMRPGQAHSWLSGVRNDVQYRQHYGVWFPAEHTKNQRREMSRIVRRWTGDPMEVDLHAGRSELGGFVAACIFTISFCRALVLRVSERSTAGRSGGFVSFGPLTLLRQSGAH